MRATYTVSGTLASGTSTTFRVEIFYDPVCDGSGHGEAREKRGFVDVTTNGSGTASFTAVSAGGSVVVGGSVSATATESDGNTSEFSACVTVTGAPDAAQFTVNSAGDSTDGACDAAHCTLREAINAANGDPGVETIRFSIGTGPVTISPSSALPVVTSPVIIDATTQPGYGGTPLVRLDGVGAGASTPGIEDSGRRLDCAGLRDHPVHVGRRQDVRRRRQHGRGQLPRRLLQRDRCPDGRQRHVRSPRGLRLGGQPDPPEPDRRQRLRRGRSISGVGIWHTAANNVVEDNGVGANDAPVGPSETFPNAIGVIISEATGTRLSSNTMAHSTGAGVWVFGATTTGNAITANNIHTNGGLGIDLEGGGVTANDAFDADTGANEIQNFPVIAVDGDTIQGTLHSKALFEYRLEFFSSAACDASGNGEGARFLGATNSVGTGQTGNGEFSASFPWLHQ